MSSIFFVHRVIRSPWPLRLRRIFARLLRNILFVGAAWPFVLLYAQSRPSSVHKEFLITRPENEENSPFFSGRLSGSCSDYFSHRFLFVWVWMWVWAAHPLSFAPPVMGDCNCLGWLPAVRVSSFVCSFSRWRFSSPNVRVHVCAVIVGVDVAAALPNDCHSSADSVALVQLFRLLLLLLAAVVMSCVPTNDFVCVPSFHFGLAIVGRIGVYPACEHDGGRRAAERAVLESARLLLAT